MNKEKEIEETMMNILKLQNMGLLSKNLLKNRLTVLFINGQIYQLEKQLSK